jgi:hypothetical protein
MEQDDLLKIKHPSGAERFMTVECFKRTWGIINERGGLATHWENSKFDKTPEDYNYTIADRHIYNIRMDGPQKGEAFVKTANGLAGKIDNSALPAETTETKPKTEK